MPLFKPLSVPRSNVAHQNPFTFDSGRAVQEFFPPGSKYMGREVIPADNKWSDGSHSFMSPMRHYHLLQEEVFHVESGSGIWSLQGREVHLSAGQDITIPRFVAHNFVNASETEPLVFSYGYDEQMYVMERRFFCNTLTYMWDCRRAGVEPSVLQLAVFLSDAWMPGEFVRVPGGEYLSCFVNALLMWIMAVIGRVLFGYKGTYDEYYDETWWRNEVGKEK